MKQDEREHKRRLEAKAAVRRKNVADFWLRFSVHFRPWLKELTRQYMEHNPMPPYACWILPSYYTDKDDREIAAWVAMLITEHKALEQRCRELRAMMGAHPFAWFRDRGFVTLGFANVRERYTGRVKGWRLADALSALWEGRRRYGVWKPEDMGVGEERVRMARMAVPSLDDGSAPCPFTDDVADTLKAFFPDYRRLASADEAISLFGFERDSDFFYATLAWKDLQRRNPKACSRLVTVYNKRYRECNIVTQPIFWTGRRGILPKIIEN